MPGAPYPIIEPPNGNFRDVFDKQAMEMAVIHNLFIRGLNAIILQAPHITKDQVQPFIHFCTIYTEMIHNHHKTEETVFFPEIEKRLGLHTMDPNIDQHRAFDPLLDDFEAYIKSVQEGTTEYDGELVVSKLTSFAPVLVTHLHDEIKTLDSSRLRQAFDKEELQRINKQFVDAALAHATLENSFPFFLVCHDKELTPWFDHLPFILVLAAKYWFSRKHAEAWKFGPCDMSMRPKKEFMAEVVGTS